MKERMAAVNSKAISVAHFKIADEGYFRGIVVNVRNAGTRDIHRRLEVVDVEELAIDSAGNLKVNPLAIRNNSLQTFVGEEIEELFIEELCPSEYRLRKDAGEMGLTERKKILRSLNNNAHLTERADINLSKTCLAGRSGNVNNKFGSSPDGCGYDASTAFNDNDLMQNNKLLEKNGLISDTSRREQSFRKRTHILNGRLSPIIDETDELDAEEQHQMTATNCAVDNATSENNGKAVDPQLRLRIPAKMAKTPPSKMKGVTSSVNKVENHLPGLVLCSAEEDDDRLSPVSEYRYPTEYFLIDRINDDFSFGVNDIKAQNEIGVCFSGQNLGRQGSLCWLQIATHVKIYLFDLVALGIDVFEKGEIPFSMQTHSY